MQIALLLVMSIILVGFVSSQSAFAQSDNQGFKFTKESIIFGIQSWVEDVRINFAQSEDKIELIKEFVAEKQARIDNAVNKGENVSLDVEERRKELLDVSKYGISSDDLEIFNNLKDEINVASEYNEIRILYSQFDDCTLNCTELEKQEFNDKVNSLDTWKLRCSGEFDIHEYALQQSSFDKLAQKCPDLNKFSQNHLKSAISGKV